MTTTQYFVLSHSLHGMVSSFADKRCLPAGPEVNSQPGVDAACSGIAILIAGLKSVTMEAGKQMRVSRPYKISESSKVREQSLPTRGIYSDLLILADISLTVATRRFAEELWVSPTPFYRSP